MVTEIRSRLSLFCAFQVFAFAALISPSTVKRGFKGAVVEGLHPGPCREVLQAIFKLKLHGEDECAKRLADSVVSE